MSTPTWRITGALIARTKRSDPTADVTELRRRLKVEQLEERLRQLLESDLPPTDEQRRHLAHLILDGAR